METSRHRKYLALFGGMLACGPGREGDTTTASTSTGGGSSTDAATSDAPPTTSTSATTSTASTTATTSTTSTTSTTDAPTTTDTGDTSGGELACPPGWELPASILASLKISSPDAPVGAFDPTATYPDGTPAACIRWDGEALAGIVTDRDLRNRVLAVGLGADRPVQEVMTAGPFVGDADALAFEVLLEMVGRNIHHLPILEHDRPIGVVTTTDLMRMVQASPVYVVGDIQKQSDVEGVATVSARLPAVVEALVGQDASADDIGRVVTAIGDAVERRLITLAEAELGGAPVPYTWVALGSRARLEQALAADQDNAIIISDEATDADLAWFEELARRVSAGLVECGYPTCPGDVMATNPRWRLRLQDWRQEFATWLTQPVPDAILQASIFFDMRPVHGDSGLFPELHHGILARAPQSRLFLAHLAKAATLNEPPLGFFRGFVLAKEGEHADTLDIKRGGIGAVVELARVHALALGSPAVNTVARLQAAIAGGIMSEEKGADLTDALEFISYVRLRHQAAQVREGRPVDNHVNPDQLSSFDKRHLREAFAIVRSAQSAMASRYPTTFM